MAYLKKLIPRAHVGYEMVEANSALRASLVITTDLISNKREWNNCFIKNT